MTDWLYAPKEVKDAAKSLAKTQNTIAEIQEKTERIKQLHALADAVKAHGFDSDYQKVQASLHSLVPEILEEAKGDDK